jgi:putative endonuclease
MNKYYVYLLINDKNHTYIGITNNLLNRLNKHNNKSGAKATKKSSNWKFNSIYGMFTKGEALSFEWYWKHTKTEKTNKWIRTKSGITNKIKRVTEILSDVRWNNIKKLNI